MIHGIIAIDSRGAIGLNGRLPWGSIPADMAKFKALTMGHAVVMGRKTWESIPTKFRPLPGRTNIVVTRDLAAWKHDEVVAANTIDAALSVAEMLKLDVFVIGGAQIYQAAATRIDRWHVTRIDGVHEADTFYAPILPGLPHFSEQLMPGVRYEEWRRS